MQDTSLNLDMKGHRILAAIVFTDAVNFSAQMSKDEEQTLTLIQRDLHMMTEVCERFEGQVLKTTGDGLLMYFVSAVQAVACALEIQKALAIASEHLPPQEVLKHRIGIHLGDVFFTESDVMGNGVNVAARLQTLAEPGGICLSQTVYDVVKNGLALQAIYLGPKELKNIQEAVPVYQLVLSPVGISGERQGADTATRLTREQYRDRQILINKVRNYWIKGVLETSLHGRALIELGLQERANALERPWDLVWQTADELQQPLPPGTRVLDKFNELGAGRTLLILGEPGSGKTTTLLELAHDLLVHAEHDITQPIPVVFNLCSWMGEKQTIADWLVKELHVKYQVSQEIGKNWLKDQQLLLMLDGLDEVSAERRDACVQAINQFSQEYGKTEMVVTSRLGDYEALKSRLQLQGALCLQPLSLEQIHQYLASAGEELIAVKQALQADTTLQELARSPLMLSIMTLAYQGKTLADLPPMHSIEERRRHLFNSYIERMFKRRGVDKHYSKEQAMRWLIWLAQKLVQQSQTMFLIERLQPSWLQNKQQKQWYAIICGLIAGFVGGVGTGVNVGMILGWELGLMAGLILALGGAIVAGLIFGLISNQINPVQTLKWSWGKARDNLKIGLGVGLIFGSIVGLTTLLFSGLIYDASIELMDGLIYGLIPGIGVGLIFILLRGLSGSGIETSTRPNQGIWQAAKNTAVFAVLGAMGLGLTASLVGLPILFGAIVGVLFGLFGAGEACIQHFSLRLVLYSKGYIPWNYARFLNWATERIFLQKVGGGYIFIHRLLLEHFAQMNPTGQKDEG